MNLKTMIPQIFCLILTTGYLASSEAGQINQADAQKYFDELKRISDSDNGKLWGKTLYGPTLFVDPDSRIAVANQPDPGGLLKAQDGLYIGKIGAETNIANTAIKWSGTYWTMVRWDAISGSDQYDRARLLIHESWHRIQDEIGIPSAISSNIYLDDIDGRVSLLLEFRALSHALTAAEKSEKDAAIRSALMLRKARQIRYPNNNENAFERNEGIAEYTGLRLCGAPDSLILRLTVGKLLDAENNEGLANSFPYLTGPAIGLLLDQLDPAWRQKASKGKDLPNLLSNAISWQAPTDEKQIMNAADSVGALYGADSLHAEEITLAKAQNNILDDFRNRIQKQGQLLIRNENLQFSYNPQEKLVSYDTIGVIYKSLRLTGNFGVLEGTGVLRYNNWQAFVVPAPDTTAGSNFEWDGCKLQLNPGWHIAPKDNKTFIIEK